MQSELNQADYACRGIMPSEMRKLKIWQHGPEFLRKNVEHWPVQPLEASGDLLESDEGVNKEKVTVGAATVWANFWNTLFQRYSTWNRLRKIVAWLIRASRVPVRSQHKDATDDNSKEGSNCTAKCLSVLDFGKTEKEIVEIVQRQSLYNDESTLKGRLARLKPFEEGELVRVGGRLNHWNLQYDAKHSMVLPKRHPVTKLIIRHYHQLNGHVGTYQVLAEIRQRFWIVRVVSTAKSVHNKCHTCPLPIVRVSSDSHRIIYPFAAVGVDYFGPLYVKMRPSTRSKRDPTLNKRYGYIFTCPGYRTVHIEVAKDLTTDCFINAALLFVGRRGPPTVIYSDNGTNFREAELDAV